MSKHARIAVTVPSRTFAALEEARRKAGLGRSAAVAQAIEDWVAARADHPRGANARYVEGYLRFPEDLASIAPVAEAAIASFGAWTDDAG